MNNSVQSVNQLDSRPVIDMDISQHRAESGIRNLVLTKIMWSNFGKKHTEIGKVLEVKSFCHLDVHRIEIQISSASGDTHQGLGGHIPRVK